MGKYPHTKGQDKEEKMISDIHKAACKIAKATKVPATYIVCSGPVADELAKALDINGDVDPKRRTKRS